MGWVERCGWVWGGHQARQGDFTPWLSPSSAPQHGVGCVGPLGGKEGGLWGRTAQKHPGDPPGPPKHRSGRAVGLGCRDSNPINRTSPEIPFFVPLFVRRTAQRGTAGTAPPPHRTPPGAHSAGSTHVSPHGAQGCGPGSPKAGSYGAQRSFICSLSPQRSRRADPTAARTTRGRWGFGTRVTTPTPGISSPAREGVSGARSGRSVPAAPLCSLPIPPPPPPHPAELSAHHRCSAPELSGAARSGSPASPLPCTGSKGALGPWLRRCLVRWEPWLKASPHSGHS